MDDYTVMRERAVAAPRENFSNTAIAGTSNSSGGGNLSLATTNNPPQQWEVQSIADKLNDPDYLCEHTGIWLEFQRQGGPAFGFLATDPASPYLENRPLTTPGQPESRDYRACWWDNDPATLAFSPVLRVIVGG